METTFGRGSEWRRWDLHVHTPESALENNFPEWPEYVSELEKRGAGISVIGVTDYASIEGYRRLLDYKNNKGRLKTFDLLIPNIEFRTQPQTSSGKAINLHLLISPADSDHVKRIDTAMSQFLWRYDGTPYACTRQGLIDLGRAIDPTKTDDNTAFKHGALNFKPNYTEIDNWLAGDVWLKRNSIIVVSGRKDGINGLTESGFLAVKEEILRMSHMIFSSSPSDRKFFLAQGKEDLASITKKCGGPKPCVHGSDAHEIEKLFKPDLNRYCWIKADPTFEGLRQICHEPDHRVHIGETAPTAFDTSKIIDSVQLDFPSVFATNKVTFNPGLVAIIGEKGSGKTALAEVIAFACGAQSVVPGSTSFIRRAGQKLSLAKIKVSWADTKMSSATIPTAPKLAAPLVRYLSQDFVERLCSEDLSGAELVKEIEGVVFSHLGEAEKLDSSSFEELRRLKTATITTRKNTVGAQINELNAELDQLQHVIDERPKKLANLEAVGNQISGIDAQLPGLQGGVNQEVAQKLDEENATLATLTSQLAGLNRKRANVQNTRGEVEDYIETVDEGFQYISKSLLSVGVPQVVVDSAKPSFPKSITDLLDQMDSELASQATVLAGDEEKTTEGGVTIADVKARIVNLQEQLANDAQVRERVIALQEQRARLVADKARIEREIEEIDGKHSSAFASKVAERWDAYGTYFDLLDTEAKTLRGLYTPLEKILKKDATPDIAEFKFSIRRSVDANAWIETGRSLVDNRKKHPLSDRLMANDLAEQLAEVWRSGDKAAIQARLELLLKEMVAGGRVEDILVSHATRKQFFDWLFSADHLSIMYSLKYGETDLQALSPGTRGIVLLMLYLRMDTQDRRPLIIDQPEGNLDSASIYRLLVPFLREAKRGRQIILVTHNPNLVVATDADQVIVADMKRKAAGEIPELSYRGGPLEDASGPDATRPTVCRILEGGAEAFKTRETRYAIPGRLPSGISS